ncbi:hypothetical protein E4U21_007114 [Claviceps maximensis]|nr:hypothetical protein E4U21_007114 [Claviceps maximensis]
MFPRRIWDRLKLTIFGWEFKEKLGPFEQVAKHHGSGDGDGQASSFSLVGIGCVEIWTTDPVAAHDMMSRSSDFHVPAGIKFGLSRLGPNILTTEGEIWARHRKMVTSALDEFTLKNMFQESIKNTRRMLRDLKHSAPSRDTFSDKEEILETRHLFDMLKKVTIHSLLTAGMGIHVAWKDEDEKAREPRYKMTYFESLVTMVANLSGVGLLPCGLLNKWPRWAPGHAKMTAAGCAKTEIMERHRLLVEQERASYLSNEEDTLRSNDERQTIVKKFLKINEALARSGAQLSEADMASNMSIFTIAGFEMTSSTLAFSCVLLARFPDWQSWLHEEVDELTADDDDDDDDNSSSEQETEGTWDYASVYPRAVRTRAFMLETMRLYAPLLHLRRDAELPQMLRTAKGAIPVPADAAVHVNLVALHLQPSWRGINHASDPAFYRDADSVEDEHAFRPSRWLNPPDRGNRRIYNPPQGSWLPWSMGSRACPGKNLSRVEYAAIMLALLQRYRLEAVPLPGEGQAEVAARLDATLRDSSCQSVLQMNSVYGAGENGGLLVRLRRRR